MKFKMSFLKLVIPMFFLLLTFACEDDPVEPEETLFDIQGENGFVGTVDGTDAFIALLIADKEAIVYVCNGEEEIYEWFRGNITDPENISLNNGYGSQVVGKYVDRSFTGNVILSNGNTHSFSAIPNTGNEKGIFQVYGDLAAQEGIVAGWILNTSGEERGSFRFNSVFVATPVKPKTSTIMFKSNSFSIQRFSSIYHPDSLTVIQVNR
jgi:hypothetical protein